MMKILLIQPLVKDPYLAGEGYKFEPLGIGYIGAYLKSRGYEELDIVVCGNEQDEKRILDLALSADIAGITASSTMMYHGKVLAGKIKEINPNILTVFGGVYPTTMPDKTLKDTNIDIVVRGEGEITFFEIVQKLDTKADWTHVDGISFKNNGKACHNKDRALIEDLDSLPFPLRKEMAQEKFLFSTRNSPSVHMISSRGCPFFCSFCASNKVWTRRYRTRSAVNLITEMKELVNTYPIKHINFAEDTFTANRRKVEQFCRLKTKEKIHLTWSCNVHANTVDSALLKTMADAGCIEIWVGVESGSPAILKELNKKTTIEKIKNCFKWAKLAGMKRHAYLIVGSPSETSKTIKETVDLVHKINPDSIEVWIFTPFPGSPYFEKAKKNNSFNINIDWTKINLLFDSTIPTREFSVQRVPALRKELLKVLKQYNPEKHPSDD